jgi:uncharacterized membrane protein YkvA (DUF1232 family)
MLRQLKIHARTLKREAYAMYLAARDPRTPWYIRALIFLVVAHTFSPIDLIPDFIPILGYLDDLIITPGGIWLAVRLAVRLVPPEVMEEARRTAAIHDVDRSAGKIGAVLIILLWIIAAAGTLYLFLRFTNTISFI